jgi:hypothetical protein
MEVRQARQAIPDKVSIKRSHNQLARLFAFYVFWLPPFDIIKPFLKKGELSKLNSCMLSFTREYTQLTARTRVASSAPIVLYITNLVCYTYFHWFFNPECQHIFGKQTGYIFQSPKTIKTWTTKHYASLNQWYNTE